MAYLDIYDGICSDSHSFGKTVLTTPKPVEGLRGYFDNHKAR